MTLQQLEYVVSLDTDRNFVKASEICHVTQPTLTMQLQKLEAEIGFRLFDRSRKPLIPTSLGELFINKARMILHEVNELKSLVSNEIENVSGNFRLGIIPTLAPYLLPLLLPELTRHYPDTHLVIEELQSTMIIDRLKSSRLDLGLLATPLNEKALREITLFHEPFLLYLSVNHPFLKTDELTPSMLDRDNLLLLSEGHCFRNQALNLCEMSRKEPVKGFSYESGSIETLKGLVDKKMGYTLVPELSVRNELKIKPSIRRFASPEPSREISLVCHSSYSREKLIEIIRDTIQKNLPDNLKRSRNYVRVKWR